MKKITLFFAALAVAFGMNAAEASGNLTDNNNALFGSYNATTNVFTPLEDPSKIALDVNTNCLTFSILVTKTSLVDFLEANPTYTLAFVDMRSWGGLPAETVFADNATRLVRVDGAKAPSGADVPGIVFYICQYNLGEASQTLPAAPGNHFGTTYIVASPVVEEGEPEFWYAESFAHAEELAGFVYLGEIDPANTECEECDDVAVEDIFADKGEVVSVELFSILGAKLPATAKGLVIAKATYADGSVESKKVVIE